MPANQREQRESHGLDVLTCAACGGEIGEYELHVVVDEHDHKRLTALAAELVRYEGTRVHGRCLVARVD